MVSPVVQKLQKYTYAQRTRHHEQSRRFGPNSNTTDQTVDRIDQNIGDKVRLFFRYQRRNDLGGSSPIAANGTTHR